MIHRLTHPARHSYSSAAVVVVVVVASMAEYLIVTLTPYTWLWVSSLFPSVACLADHLSARYSGNGVLQVAVLVVVAVVVMISVW